MTSEDQTKTMITTKMVKSSNLMTMVRRVVVVAVAVAVVEVGVVGVVE